MHNTAENFKSPSPRLSFDSPVGKGQRPWHNAFLCDPVLRGTDKLGAAGVREVLTCSQPPSSQCPPQQNPCGVGLFSSTRARCSHSGSRQPCLKDTQQKRAARCEVSLRRLPKGRANVSPAHITLVHSGFTVNPFLIGFSRQILGTERSPGEERHRASLWPCSHLHSSMPRPSGVRVSLGLTLSQLP